MSTSSERDTPPVLSKPVSTSSNAENPSTTATTVTTCSNSAGSLTSGPAGGDSVSKITTATVASSVSTPATTVSNASTPTSGKSTAAETKKTASGSGGAAGSSSSSAETASPSSSLPQQTSKTRRKPSSRAKKDTDDKNKSSASNVSTTGVQMVPQAPLMLTSAPPGQFMLVHHNGQCYMMSTAQYFGTNQQIATVRPQQQQQQQQQLLASATTSTTATSSTVTTTATSSTTSARDFLKAIHQQQQQQQQQTQATTNAALVAAQQFYSQQQQYRHLHQMHSQQQQQYLQPGMVANSATLGQLARSLAPKPTLSGSVSGAASSAQMSSLATTTVTASTPTAGQSNDAARTAQQQLPQQLCATPVQQIQPSMFPQGIQLRAPQGSSGIVFQMPSGSYTYVHQLVTSQQRSSTAVPQLQQIPACIGQAVATSQPQNQQQPATTVPSIQKVAIPASAQSKSKSSPTKEPSAAEPSGGNASPSVNKEGQTLAQITSSPSQSSTTSFKVTETQSKSTKGGGKNSGGGRKATSGTMKAPQPIAPSNLVPVGAPVPMMVMSAAMPQISSFAAGPTTVPFMGPNGQIIHQQLIANPPVPTHQMISVFQQQQQSGAHFAVTAQPPPAPAPENSRDSQKPQTEDDNGFTDSGIENEPPPLLVQGESKDAFDIHMMFTREAERYYQKAGRKGKIVHLIEGFEIEESDEPFPCEPPCRLSDWLLSEAEEKESIKSPEEVVRSPSPRKATSEKDMEVTMEIKTEKPETKKGRTKASPTKSVNSEPSAEKTEKKTRKRKTNEDTEEGSFLEPAVTGRASSERTASRRGIVPLDRLLQMDFGPSHGRLCDIMEKSYVKPTKENKEPPKSPAKTKGRPSSSSVEKQKVETVEVDEPVMERFIIEDIVESPQRPVSKKSEESPTTADNSLNTSSKSSGDTLNGSLVASFSDEELDTERCNYCNGLLRLKRLENHPQYCSKKCRKLWKKNPALGEEQVARSFNASPRLPAIRSTDTSPTLKEVSPTVAVANISVVSESSPAAVASEPQQRSPPTLTLKMVSPQQAEIVKSPRAASASYSQGECSKIPSTSVSPAAAPEKTPVDYMSRATKTWTCDEVASWVASVTGNEDCANTFRNQDIDGQSLLLLADNAHHNLGTLLGLKLGPVVKILNALKELCAKSINAA